MSCPFLAPSSSRHLVEFKAFKTLSRKEKAMQKSSKPKVRSLQEASNCARRRWRRELRILKVRRRCECHRLSRSASCVLSGDIILFFLLSLCPLSLSLSLRFISLLARHCSAAKSSVHPSLPSISSIVTRYSLS